MNPPRPPIRRPEAPDTPEDPTISSSDGSRLLAALAYVPFLCFIPYFIAPNDEFARFHARQGFLLLALTVVLGLALRVIEWSMAGIPVLGIVVITLARLSFGLTLLGLGVAGALKALLGERWPIPGFERFANRVPL
ncbi:MAG TPA: hypothetical protein VNM87_15440 [Candidatus Udaeobacter sp.]|nr:hypothetical protein [Candidatus Udaeobacter sp.]